MAEFLDICEQVARKCGQVLLDMRGTVRSHQKAPKDLVTEADFASQELARRLLLTAFPDHRFLGEESDEEPGRTGVPSSDQQSEYCWIVDPLDGTLNYVRQLPNYSVSVALRRGSEILVGTVYDPLLDECYSAAAGKGAFLNGVPIHASGCQLLEHALVAASLPTDVPRNSPEVSRFIEVMHSSQAVRRLGSAALSLCYVASGRLDAYWATCVKVWDVAAGQLIVREAGGSLTHPDGSPFDLDRPQFVAAATPPLHGQLVDLLARAVEPPRSAVR
ncbi:MAG: inositol monophosphatase family protein [Pirellulaceae bacterium]